MPATLAVIGTPQNHPETLASVQSVDCKNAMSRAFDLIGRDGQI
jgi:hypothetical protein